MTDKQTRRDYQDDDAMWYQQQNSARIPTAFGSGDAYRNAWADADDQRKTAEFQRLATNALWSSNGGHFIPADVSCPPCNQMCNQGRTCTARRRSTWGYWLLALFFIVAMILWLPWAN